MNFYANSPVEASLWATAVQIQESIADALNQSELLTGVSVLVFSLLMLKAFLNIIGQMSSPSHAAFELMVRLCLMMLGISMLTQKSAGVKITTSEKKEWSAFNGVEYEPTNGLYWYTHIHVGLNNLGSWLTDLISNQTVNGSYQMAPEGTFRIAAAASRVMFDDPNILGDFHRLDSNCIAKDAQIVSLKEGLSNFYDLSEPFCKTTYDRLLSNLNTWASNKVPWYDSFRVQVGACKFYLWCDREAMKKALIAFATRNLAQEQYDKTFGVHDDLLSVADNSEIDRSPLRSPAGAMYVDRLLSAQTLLTGLSNGLLMSGAGEHWTNGYKNDFRNHAAKKYDQLLELLPAIRGYSHAISAYAFIAAAIALCCGLLAPLWAWFKLCFLLSMYEPLAALLYYTARSQIKVSQISSLEASNATDPTMIGIAQYLVSEVARVETIYFGLQCFLIMCTCFIGYRFFSNMEFKPYFSAQQVEKITRLIPFGGMLGGR